MYDPSREDEKLENRVFKEIDRRIIEVLAKVDIVDKKIEKILTNNSSIDDRKMLTAQFNRRYILSVVVTTIIQIGIILIVYFLSKH